MENIDFPIFYFAPIKLFTKKLLGDYILIIEKFSRHFVKDIPVPKLVIIHVVKRQAVMTVVMALSCTYVRVQVYVQGVPHSFHVVELPEASGQQML